MLDYVRRTRGANLPRLCHVWRVRHLLDLQSRKSCRTLTYDVPVEGSAEGTWAFRQRQSLAYARMNEPRSTCRGQRAERGERIEE
jgi:hypothetical protein